MEHLFGGLQGRERQGLPRVQPPGRPCLPASRTGGRQRQEQAAPVRRRPQPLPVLPFDIERLHGPLRRLLAFEPRDLGEKPGHKPAHRARRVIAALHGGQLAARRKDALDQVATGPAPRRASAGPASAPPGCGPARSGNGTRGPAFRGRGGSAGRSSCPSDRRPCRHTRPGEVGHSSGGYNGRCLDYSAMTTVPLRPNPITGSPTPQWPLH